MVSTDAIAAARCANCAEALTGRFCAHCGQAARDLRRPLLSLVKEAVEDVVGLDTRLARTVRPLLIRSGHVTKEYLSGRRVALVPPLRAYLIGALVFFSLFTLLPTRTPPVYVYTSDSPEAAQVRGSSARGSRVTIELPKHVWFGDLRFQEVSARARANPDAFALAAYRNVPHAFFLFLPIVVVMLKIFYRKQGYYIDHLGAVAVAGRLSSDGVARHLRWVVADDGAEGRRVGSPLPDRVRVDRLHVHFVPGRDHVLILPAVMRQNSMTRPPEGTIGIIDSVVSKTRPARSTK